MLLPLGCRRVFTRSVCRTLGRPGRTYHPAHDRCLAQNRGHLCHPCPGYQEARHHQSQKCRPDQRGGRKGRSAESPSRVRLRGDPDALAASPSVDRIQDNLGGLVPARTPAAGHGCRR
eukprot:scaffold320181_cov32-Tisochrysis_lutea.AAC.3